MAPSRDKGAVLYDKKESLFSKAKRIQTMDIDSMAVKRLRYQNRVNVDSKVQTGMQSQSWSWNSYHFYWDGSVASGDKFKVWLTPPIVTRRIWRVLTFIGVIFLLYIFIREFC